MTFRVIGWLIIVAAIITTGLLVGRREEKTRDDLDSPSPALGKTFATAIHQALTDPYFLPLEKVTAYLDRNPGVSGISVDLMTKYAPDDDFPTNFVWTLDGGKLQLDRETDRETIEVLLDKLKSGLESNSANQLLYLKYFKVNGEKFWLGFIRVPLGSGHPTQIVGSFFSLDRYIERDMPRLLGDLLDRPRFPLIPIEKDSPLLSGNKGGHIAIRILDKEGGTVFTRGQTFAKEKMIYAESQFYPKPVVALMEGWDLQIFSANAGESEKKKGIPWNLIVVIGAIIVSTVAWWWGTKPNRAEVTVYNASKLSQPKYNTGQKINLEETESDKNEKR